MRGVVDGVDPGQRAGIVGQATRPLGIDDRPDRVRGPGEGDDPRPIVELALEVREVERGVIPQLDVLDDEVAVVGELEPRRHAPVVVERGDEDLVAGRELATGSARQREVQRGHVRSEDHLVRLAPEEPRRAGLGLLEDAPHTAAGLVAGAHVRARLAQRAGDRLAHLVGHLRTAGRIEESEPLVQRGEALPHGRDVELVGGLGHL